jgi:ABC-2 type transport system permease protein
MNILKFELKRSFLSMVGWTLGMIACISVFMQGMFPIYNDSIDQIMIMMASFPKEFLAAFGFSMDMFSFAGFYAFSFTYLTLLGVMFSCTVTLQIFAREKRSHCQEFLYAKPVTRQKMFTEKLLAVLALLLISNALLVAWSVAVTIMAGENDLVGEIALASLSIFCTELLFMAFVILYSIQARKVRTISGVAMAFAFAGFILSALSSLIDKVEMRYLAPFKYFDPFQAVMNGTYEIQYVITAMVLFIAVMTVAAVRYFNKDVRL